MFRKLRVVLLSVAALVVELDAFKRHALIRNHEAAFKREDTGAVQEQKRVFDVAQRDRRLGEPALLSVVSQQLHGRKGERNVVGRPGTCAVLGYRFERLHDKGAQVGPHLRGGFKFLRRTFGHERYILRASRAAHFIKQPSRFQVHQKGRDLFDVACRAACQGFVIEFLEIEVGAAAVGEPPDEQRFEILIGS